MFTEIDTETGVEQAQTIVDVSSSASVTTPVRFVPGHNNHEASPSISIMDLTSIGNVHATGSGDKE